MALQFGQFLEPAFDWRWFNPVLINAKEMFCKNQVLSYDDSNCRILSDYLRECSCSLDSVNNIQAFFYDCAFHGNVSLTSDSTCGMHDAGYFYSIYAETMIESPLEKEDQIYLNISLCGTQNIMEYSFWNFESRGTMEDCYDLSRNSFDFDQVYALPGRPIPLADSSQPYRNLRMDGVATYIVFKRSAQASDSNMPTLIPTVTPIQTPTLTPIRTPTHIPTRNLGLRAFIWRLLGGLLIFVLVLIVGGAIVLIYRSPFSKKSGYNRISENEMQNMETVRDKVLNVLGRDSPFVPKLVTAFQRIPELKLIIIFRVLSDKIQLIYNLRSFLITKVCILQGKEISGADISNSTVFRHWKVLVELDNEGQDIVLFELRNLTMRTVATLFLENEDLTPWNHYIDDADNFTAKNITVDKYLKRHNTFYEYLKAFWDNRPWGNDFEEQKLTPDSGIAVPVIAVLEPGTTEEREFRRKSEWVQITQEIEFSDFAIKALVYEKFYYPYSLTTNNCHHFAETMYCKELGQKLPSNINSVFSITPSVGQASNRIAETLNRK